MCCGALDALVMRKFYISLVMTCRLASKSRPKDDAPGLGVGRVDGGRRFFSFFERVFFACDARGEYRQVAFAFCVAGIVLVPERPGEKIRDLQARV